MTSESFYTVYCDQNYSTKFIRTKMNIDIPVYKTMKGKKRDEIRFDPIDKEGYAMDRFLK